METENLRRASLASRPQQDGEDQKQQIRRVLHSLIPYLDYILRQALSDGRNLDSEPIEMILVTLSNRHDRVNRLSDEAPLYAFARPCYSVTAAWRSARH